jgi:diadenosine tetraphosphate (Ap4A) HIT family hydrolase
MSHNLAKNLSPRKWRTQATHNQYEEDREQDLKSNICPLCEEIPLNVFNYWKIFPNKYPYDAVSDNHDLLLPKRHVANYQNLSKEEVEELISLKESYLNQNYTYLIEAMTKNKSIPGHLHYHLIEPKTIDQ